MTGPEGQPARDPRDDYDDEELHTAQKADSDADVPDADLDLEPSGAPVPESDLPEADAPPRVVGEAPVGGKLPPAPRPRPEAAPDEPPVRDMPTPDDLVAAGRDEPVPAHDVPGPVEELRAKLGDAEAKLSDHEPAVEEGESGAATGAALHERPQTANEVDEVDEGSPEAAPMPDAPPADDSAVPAHDVPGPVEALRAKLSDAEADLAEHEPAVGEGESGTVTGAALHERPQTADDTPAVPSKTERAARPAEPAPAPDSDPLASADEWDEDISPELAAILFSGGAPKVEQSAPERPAPPPPTPAAADAAPTDAAASDVRVTGERSVQPAAETKPSGPVFVTGPDEARSLPLVAGDLSSPPPDAALSGKKRYQRVEEPLRGDNGTRTQESWDYYGPDLPALDGRLVRHVEIEEHAYADGSWRWRFQRDYTDGRDRREVRLSGEHDYAERQDEIKKKDDAGKTVRASADVALIYAAPKRDAKRGFLSNLLGRGGNGDHSGPKMWREATDSEQRAARKDGGEAFHRKLFGIF